MGTNCPTIWLSICFYGPVRVLFWAPATLARTSNKARALRRRSPDAHCPDALHSDRQGGTETEVEAHARHEWAAVVHNDHHGLPGLRIRHVQSRAERESAVSGGKAIGIERFTAGGALACPIIG